MDTGSLIRRRRESPACARSFARYCVALLGSLTVVSVAAPVASRGEKRNIRAETRAVIDMGAPSIDTSLHNLLPRAAQGQTSINKAATIVGVCGGLALVFAIVGGVLFWRSRRQRHKKGKCKCKEKGIACKYRRVPSDAHLDESGVETDDGPQERGGVTPPGSPRQSMQSLLSPPTPADRNSIRWSVSGPRDSGPFFDVEGFEYPANYKPPPSSFRAHSPSASSEFLVPSGIANLISPVSPLLGHHRLSGGSEEVSITPPRTPSPARFAKRSQSPHLRGRSMSAVDLSRSDGELQEDLDAIVRELQRRPRAGSIDSRLGLTQSRSNSPGPRTSTGSVSQEFIMELEASPGMWNEDMQRNRGVVHEAVNQEFAVELDSRPLILGLRRTRRMTGRFS
ncbi:hypothetical protein Dda_8923 [Drechslerella dactyloides]|uniref:Uncharacterized protein n=1 Tax=Drechslerella dactyloides TaxID=74499 RepID=A0AAD6IU18_DREDA|nr:hypothetical protein Dda_8923 [Drechslerella dactyloides]